MTIVAASQVWEFLRITPGNPSFPSEFTDPNQPVGIEDVQLNFFPASLFITQPLTPEPISAGVAIGGFSDYYVDRVWIDPVPIEFGSIIDNVSVTVDILNTFRYESRALLALDLSAVQPGVDIEPSTPVPINLLPTQQGSVILTATFEDGPPSFSDDVVFVFDHRIVDVQASGRRLILFWYEPEQPLEEQLSWFTDVIENRDGNESRDSKRTTPRQQFEFNIVAETEQEAGELRNLLLTFRSFSFGIPVWIEQRQVTAPLASGGTVIQVNTQSIDHRVGGSILIWEPSTKEFFDAQIDSLTSSSITLVNPTSTDISADAIIVPLRFGQILEGPRYNDAIVNRFETGIVFEVTDNVDLAFADQAALEAEFPVHPTNQLPILSDPNVVRGRSQRRNQETDVTRLDAGIGLFQVVAKKPQGFLSGSKGMRFTNLAELRRWRSLLHWLRGSWGPFYMPTFRNDLPAVIDFNLNSGTITIQNVGYTQFYGAQEPHTAAMLELPDGRQFFAVITGSAIIDEDTETITLSPGFSTSAEIVTASTARISFLERVRIDGDVARILHDYVGYGSIRFPTKTIQR